MHTGMKTRRERAKRSDFLLDFDNYIMVVSAAWISGQIGEFSVESHIDRVSPEPWMPAQPAALLTWPGETSMKRVEARDGVPVAFALPRPRNAL